MRVLGIHTGIDASACLLDNGVIRFALQEERFVRKKNYVGFPQKSVAKILEMAKLSIDQIDEMAVSTTYDLVSPGEGQKPSVLAKARSLVRWKIPPLFILWEDIVPEIKKRAPPLFMIPQGVQLERRLALVRAMTGFQGQVTVVDHHLAHAASGYYSAPWKDEPVLVMSKDGSGDGLCATVGIGENGQIRKIAETKHTHSLGYLYSAVTHWMGMKAHDHEHKIMGMAPHASPDRAKAAYDKFRGLLDVEDLKFKRKVFEPLCVPYVEKHMRAIFERERFDNIAWGLQRLTEELMVKWTKNAIRRTGIRKVTGGGGVYLNVKANQLIRELPEVEGFFPMTTAGDTTTSIGSAYVVYAQRMLEQGSEVDIKPLGHLYLGDEPTGRALTGIEDELLRYAHSHSEVAFDVQHSSHVDALAAELIADGEIVARCRGPMEFGARALGNRSILCDASDLRNVGVINRAIKSRDFWMPFAPVVLEERAADYLVNPAPAPYMVMAFDTTEDARRDLIAGLHQADFTARPQIIERSWNPGYYGILERFEERSGIGGMLNTSFNLHGHPIVHGPKDALHVFQNSGLRYLVLGDYLVSKW